MNDVLFYWRLFIYKIITTICIRHAMNNHKPVKEKNFFFKQYYCYRIVKPRHPLCNEFEYLVFNATFSSVSAISWRSVLVVEEAGVPGENHRPWASNWQTLSLCESSAPLFVIYEAGRETSAVLVIGLYELLDLTTELIEPPSSLPLLQWQSGFIREVAL